ncbi:MAG: HAD family hydrolase [Nitrospinae bacterium]|nr:HAD family hydrolase [Nitrospinota bacterium]
MFQGMQAFVFDFDGTLAVLNIDFGLMRRRVNQIIERYGLDARRFDHLYILEMIDAAAAHLGPAQDGMGAGLYREAHASILALEQECARTSRLLPGVAEALQTLRRQGFKIGIVTRNSAAAVRTICATIDTLCDVFLPREAVRFVKPHPEHLGYALQRLQVPAHMAVMVGDGPIDITAGKALGLKTVAVLTGGNPREALVASQPDLILDSVADLIPRILRQGATT